MARPKSGRPPTKVISLRVDAEIYDWLQQYGDQAPDLLRSIIDESRTTFNDKAIDKKLARLRDDLTELETKALDVKKEIRELEGIKAKLQTTQLGHLAIRQRILEAYARDPDHFQGWLTGPANEHMISEGKFNSPKEVAEFCRAEMDKRRGKQ